MYCMQCNNDLSDCTCDDLQERLDNIGGALVYKKCLKCDKHYEKCECKEPVWGTNQDKRIYGED